MTVPTLPPRSTSLWAAAVSYNGSLALLGLSIFGPGIANGLIAGGPQLGAGAAVGTGLAVAGIGAVGVGLAGAGVGAISTAGGLAAGAARGGASLAGAAAPAPPGRGSSRTAP